MSVAQTKQAASSGRVSTSKLKRLANPTELLLAILIPGTAYLLWWLGKKWYTDEWYTPENGLGYWLGIIGGSMMLLAYLYSARKYLKALKFSGVLKKWLNFHIYLGVFGPYLIILHSGFKLESANATWAFYAMIAVMLSGVTGRFLYSHIHLGLSGHKVRFREVQKLFSDEEGSNRTLLASIPGMEDRLAYFEKHVLRRPTGLLSAVSNLIFIGSAGRAFYREVRRNLPQVLLPVARQRNWTRDQFRQAERQIERMLREYINAMTTVARFNIYDQLFNSWRLVHVPLLFLLLVSGIIHVWYVHMYSTS